MIEPAAVFTRPVPLPVAPAKIPVPPTIVCEISKKSGALSPADEELPGETTPTTLSRIRSVLPSSNVIVRTWQFGPQAPNATLWKATWPSPLKVALPQLVPGAQTGWPAPFSTNVAWYLSAVPAVAGAASISAATSPPHASASLNSFITVFLSVADHPSVDSAEAAFRLCMRPYARSLQKRSKPTPRSEPAFTATVTTRPRLFYPRALSDPR